MRDSHWAVAATAATPIASLDQARQAFQGYLDRTANADLVLDEVMEFEQNFYAVVKERGTDGGAFELLADKQSGVVFLEYGPAMMWNTRYGHMSGHGGMPRPEAQPSGAVAVSPERARELAQQWLDVNQPGSSTEPPDAFPGYFTVNIMRDGKVSGMLSVNATTGQLWYHNWHGAFLAEMSAG